jgi:hypothetical protein
MESNHNFNNQISKAQEIWKIKKNQCSLSLQAQHRKNDWYVDSGCSKHMRGDRNKFITLNKQRDGSVSFGNNHSAKIIGRGTIKLGIKDAMEKNVLLVEDMKHYLVSLSQMCDQGHTLKFD